MLDETKHLVVVCGPTASGKTALALDIARHFQTAILSADSRQFYGEMKIGTAPPTDEELQAAPHYFVGNKSIKEEYTAAAYAEDALKLLEQLYQEKQVAVLCGGSGLYINALLKGFDEIPAVPEEIRQQLQQTLEQQGIEQLQQLLQQHDPQSYGRMDLSNPQRVIRALEVTLGTGRPYSSFLQQKQQERPFAPIKVAIDWPRQELYSRINYRCEAMLEVGLLQEVQSLLPYRQHQALQTVGYKEFFDYLDGNCDYEEAVQKFKQHTRNYAKRQLTWFRRDDAIKWFKPEERGEVVDYIISTIKGVSF